MKKRNSVFIFLLSIIFTLVTIGISSALSRQDNKLSDAKCESLGGEVTDKYLGKVYSNKKLCVFKSAPHGVTICKANWKRCHWRPLKVKTIRRDRTPAELAEMQDRDQARFLTRYKCVNDNRPIEEKMKNPYPPTRKHARELRLSRLLL